MKDGFDEFSSLFDDLDADRRAMFDDAAAALAYARNRFGLVTGQVDGATPEPLRRLADLAAGVRSEAAFDALVLRVGSTLYAIPTSRVVDLFGCGPGDAHAIERVKGAAMIRVGDGLAPVMGLPDIFNGGVRAATVVVLVEAAGRRIGVAGDGDAGEVQAVARNLPHGLAPSAEAAGAAVLPDGSVALIPDLDAWASSPAGAGRGRKAA